VAEEEKPDEETERDREADGSHANVPEREGDAVTSHAPAVGDDEDVDDDEDSEENQRDVEDDDDEDSDDLGEDDEDSEENLRDVEDDDEDSDDLGEDDEDSEENLRDVEDDDEDDEDDDLDHDVEDDDPRNTAAPPRFSRFGAPGSPRRRRVVFFGIWGALLLLALWLFRGVLLPFFMAVVLAYVFAPVVRWLESLRDGKVPRWAAVVTVYVVLLALISAFFAVGVPRLALEVEKLAKEAPRAIATARDEWLPALEESFRDAMHTWGDEEDEALAEPDVVADDPAPEPPLPDVITGDDPDDPIPEPPPVVAEVDHSRELRIVSDGEGAFAVVLPREGIIVQPEGERMRVLLPSDETETEEDLTGAITSALQRMSEHGEDYATTALRTAQAIAKAIVKGVFTFFITLMLSAYLLITSDRILRFFRSLWPYERRRSFDVLVKRMDRGLGGVVRGQLLIALINGILSGIGFYVLGLRYWPILTLIATVLSIIPIFGTILSTIPAVIVGLQDSVTTAALVLAWIVIIHQIEGNLLNPKIMGDQAKVHPVMVVFALLAGEHLFGIAGALLAVPVLSIVQSLFVHYREIMLGDRAAT